MTSGFLGYALPRKGSYFILVQPGDTFGVVDISHNLKDFVKQKMGQLSSDDTSLQVTEALWNWDLTSPRQFRRFSVKVIDEAACEM